MLERDIDGLMDLKDMIESVEGICDVNRYSIDVVVEDDNGEVRYVEDAWYDKERKMLRLTLRNVLFTDNEED